MGSILAQCRANFKIVANDIFDKAQHVKDTILPISFKNDRDAILLNLESRKNALKYLSQGEQLEYFQEALYPLHLDGFLNQLTQCGDHSLLK